MIKKLAAILLVAALVLTLVLTPGVALATSGNVIAGNEVIDRDYGPDSWSNFYLMDQNNGFDDDSVMTAFSVYVGRIRPFHFMVYNDSGAGWEVVFNSGQIAPTEVDVLYTEDITPVCVPAGSYVGLYYPEDGAVPYSRGDTHFEYNTLERVVLFTNQGGTEVDFLHSGDRVYSIAAHGFSVDDWEFTYTGDLFLPADDVILQATLTGTDTEGHSVDFYLEGDHVGSADTNADGVAELQVGAYDSGIYKVTAEAYCFEATEELYVLDQYAKISGGIDGQGSRGKGGGKGAPTHSFEGFVGEIEGVVVGEVTINYRDLGVVCTFTPGDGSEFLINDAPGIGVTDNLRGELKTWYNSEGGIARILLLDRDAHEYYPRGAIWVDASDTTYNIKHPTDDPSWWGLDRGNVHVVDLTE